MKPAFIFVLSLLVASTAMAKICKTVGPDGSVTYTDRPGADSCADSNTTNEAAKVDATMSKKAGQTKPVGQQAVSPPVAEVASPASIERAIIGIMTTEDRVQRAYDFCAQLQPASIRRYGDAIDGWRERNASATGKMRRALAQGFNGTQQRVIREGVSKRNEREMATVLATPKTAQLKWCDQTTTEVENRAHDVPADLATPVAGF